MESCLCHMYSQDNYILGCGFKHTGVMNWKCAPDLMEYLLMYPLMPLKFTKESIYSEDIFFWCNILLLGKSAVTLILAKTLLEFGCNDYRFQILRLLFVQPYEAMSVWVAYLTDIELQTTNATHCCINRSSWVFKAVAGRGEGPGVPGPLHF